MLLFIFVKIKNTNEKYLDWTFFIMYAIFNEYIQYCIRELYVFSFVQVRVRLMLNYFAVVALRARIVIQRVNTLRVSFALKFSLNYERLIPLHLIRACKNAHCQCVTFFA